MSVVLRTHREDRSVVSPLDAIRSVVLMPEQIDVALDPEQILMCNGCGCELEETAEFNSPNALCPWQLCDCHSAYWLTVPEFEKRRLWGDR